MSIKYTSLYVNTIHIYMSIQNTFICQYNTHLYVNKIHIYMCKKIHIYMSIQYTFICVKKYTSLYVNTIYIYMSIQYTFICQ